VSSASSPFISESESVAITDRFQAMHRDIARIIIPQKRLQDRVTALAKEIASDYGRCDEGLTLVTVLSGSVIFLADLIRQLPMKMRIDLITVSSYEGKSTRSAEPKLHSDRPLTVRGRDVLIVDDILDTGKTLRLVQAWIRREEPRSVRTVVLLRKRAKAPADVAVDYIGFDIEDLFVVGYGLDYDSLYRNLPYVAVLKPELYED
jgi:hypoxanthine phosphoribosyltransferase